MLNMQHFALVQLENTVAAKFGRMAHGVSSHVCSKDNIHTAAFQVWHNRGLLLLPNINDGRLEVSELRVEEKTT